MRTIQQELDATYEAYHNPDLMKMDPIGIARCYKPGPNREVGALACCLLAYGRVEKINECLRRIRKITGNRIREFALSTSFSEKQKAFDHFKYRFNTGTDLSLLFECVKHVIKKHGTLESAFLAGMSPNDFNTEGAIHKWSRQFKALSVDIVGRPAKSFNFLFPSPFGGSPCKRINMYLRWMARPSDDGIDFGLWQNLSPSKLVIPLDTHIARLGKKLGLTRRHSPDWRMANEITENLKKFEYDDPLKYDFSLCKRGMLEVRKDHPKWQKLK